ncbi:hypothetical protein PIB30_006097 [Stylosanthes scabra]|uniref:Uncharacterized protein n=1 Tax=Stylosanthes scabra TaxID=79078 RepID=A0ABU6W4D0_9FABA|nr:hypothetical protein [Stylosanthes scabra]
MGCSLQETHPLPANFEADVTERFYEGFIGGFRIKKFPEKPYRRILFSHPKSPANSFQAPYHLAAAVLGPSPSPTFHRSFEEYPPSSVVCSIAEACVLAAIVLNPKHKETLCLEAFGDISGA